MFLSIWPVCDSVGSDVVKLTYAKESKTLQDNETEKEKITYAVSSQITAFSEASETVFIDYGQLRLYRHNKLNNSCRPFSLKNPTTTNNTTAEKEEIALQRLSNLLGHFKVIATNERKKIKTYNCQRKQIHFAYELSFSQMVVAPTINQFGQNFTESLVTYWVAEEFDSYDFLMKIARKHKGIYNATPLLRQVDMLGLLEALEGVPVKISKKVDKAIREYTLFSVEKTSEKDVLFTLPEVCRNVSQY